jgi:two-component system LytT family response regulator
MTRILIIDDEAKARNILHHYLDDMPDIEMEVREAASVDDAMALLQSYQPDLVFLDVEMPVKTGFDFLVELQRPSFDIVFTTAFSQYAIQAIKFSALDYLLKPIDEEELRATVLRHVENKETRDKNAALYDNLIENLRKQDTKDFKIAITSTQGTHFFTLDQIIRLEADSSYTHIHLINNKRFTASKTLKYFDEMLEEHGFVRIHKSHIINPVYLRQVNADHSMVTMSDGSQAEVARRKKDDVKAMMKLIH